MSDPSTVLFFALVAAIIILAFIWSPKLDRQRIRGNIEEHGGKVIEIVKVWEWSGGNDRAYDVTYMTASGKRVNATCRTRMWRGVYWINERPPGLDSGELEKPSTSYVADEPPGSAEPIQCVGCGAPIAANKASCPQCGWSYKQA
jgi:hypothetical protein